MKKNLWLYGAFLTSVGLMVGCQKQIAEVQSEQTVARTISPRVAGATCETGGCIEYDPVNFIDEESGATMTTGEYNPSHKVTVSISNDADEVIFRFSSDDPIHYIAIDGNQEFCSADDNASNPIDQGTFEIRLSIGEFETDWTGCEEKTYSVTVYRNNCAGNGGGNAVTFDATHKLVPVCTCEIEIGDYFTYSQGFYMQSSNGATFLGDHPELGDVTIGCATGAEQTFTLADIVALETGNTTAPYILGKQIITMSLNVKASELGILGTEADLGCMVVVADGDSETEIDDLFAGMSVNEILAEANNVWGGCGESVFSSDELTEILKQIVANFHEGIVDGGLLTCGSCL